MIPEGKNLLTINYYKFNEESKIGIEFSGSPFPKITKVKTKNCLFKLNDIIFQVNDITINSPIHVTTFLNNIGEHNK